MSISFGKLNTYIFIADTLLICLFVLCACIHFLSIKVYVFSTRIDVTQGILIKSSHTADLVKANSINTTQGPLQKLMGIHKTALVCAGDEVVLYLPQTSLSIILRKTDSVNKHPPTCKASFVSSLIMSAVFHNSLGTLLTLTPLLRTVSSVVDSETAMEFLEDTNILSLVLPRISPLLSTLASLIFILWLLGFFITFSRYFPLKIYTNENLITIKHGLLIKHTHTIRTTDIRSVVLRRSLLLLIIGRQCTEILFSCEKGENRLPVFCTGNHTVKETLPFLNSFCKTKFRLCPLSVWGYLWLPTAALFLFSLIIIFTDTLSPYTPPALLCVFVVLWLCLWFLLRFYAFCHSAVSYSESFLNIHSFSLFSLTEAIIPCDKIRALKITRTIFQKHRNTCSFRIYIKSRKKKSFFIKHTDHKKTAELIEKLCGNNNL